MKYELQIHFNTFHTFTNLRKICSSLKAVSQSCSVTINILIAKSDLKIYIKFVSKCGKDE